MVAVLVGLLAATASLTLAHPEPALAAGARTVSPAVHTLPLAGVDRAAFAAAPKARAAAQRASTPGRASAPVPAPDDPAPELFTPALTTDRFTAVGITWDGATRTAVSIQVRVREAGTWTGWESLASDDAAPDPGSTDDQHARGRGGTELLTTSGADGLQVRVDTADSSTPPAVRAVLVDSSPVTADSAVRATSAAAPSTVAQDSGSAAPVVTAPRPAIYSRADWGADESVKTCVAATDSTTLVGFVHHTVNLNTYTADDVPSLIRAIYAYHVQGRGWCDIGYNFLVDKFGRLWEGRYGGVDKGVVGAQVGGFNSESFGVAAIGDFSQAQPPQVMLDAIARIMAWKLSLIGRDPRGAGLVTSGGGGSLFPAGQVVALRTISGHRDAWATDCPGDFLYPRLDAIRLAAGAIVDAAHSPIGRLDAVIPVPGGLRVQGWTLDPDTTGWIYGWVDVGGRQGPVFSGRPRPDVAAVFPGYGQSHGFDETYSLPAGAYRVCAYGVNQGAGSDTGLGCLVATVGASPFGNLEEVRPVAGGIALTGWAIDPDTTAPIYVWVDVSGRGFPINTGVSRPDVVAVYPSFGDGHGFSTQVSIPPGNYAVCLTAVNTGGGDNTSLGCRNVSVT